MCIKEFDKVLQPNDYLTDLVFKSSLLFVNYLLLVHGKHDADFIVMNKPERTMNLN